MSCRSTAGGKAASACATLLIPGSAHRVPTVLHALRATEAEATPGAPQPDLDKVIETLERMAHRVRQDPDASESRKSQAIARVNAAIAMYRGGGESLPDHATLHAWQHLPAALEAERILGRRIDTSEALESPPEFRPGRDAVKPYHRAFSSLHEDIGPVTDELFRSRPSQLSLSDAKRVFEEWLGRASAIYGVPRPSFEWDPSATFAGGGEYRPRTQSIAMSKVSVTTLLHEFRHHLQHQGAAMIDPDLEEDARAWSLSLYYAVRPNLLKKMVEQGRIFHISVADLQPN